jgi:hypothetical protein
MGFSEKRPIPSGEILLQDTVAGKYVKKMKIVTFE